MSSSCLERSLATACLCMITVACGSSSSTPSTNTDSGGPPVYDTNLPSAGCGGMQAKPGTSTVTIMSAGVARTYVLHVPPHVTSQPTPLVINMHGFLSNATQQEQWSEMDATADSENFVVAYPNGAGNPASWNAGTCCDFDDTTRDDVAFIGAVIDDVAQNGCIALDRVYATGMSNGGFMSHNLACNLSDRIAAIGPVSGVLGIPTTECHPGRAVPVMEFHGTSDPLVPYDGGTPNQTDWTFLYPNTTPPTFASVADTIAFWTSQDGCTAAPMQTYSSGDATCQTYGGCAGGAAVTLCTIAGGGHTWPGGDPSALASGSLGSLVSSVIGKTSTSIDASNQLWNFFKGYKLPVGFDGGATYPPPYLAPDGGGGDAGSSDGSSE
jgi:polyhydroxybutyrate depolymerase